MNMLYRLWTKIRRPNILVWDSSHRGEWDAAVRGSSALRHAILGAFHDEVATLNGHDAASILWDLAKFYDTISIPKLVERAIGGLLVVTGVLFLTGTFSEIAYFLLEAFPALGTVG